MAEGIRSWQDVMSSVADEVLLRVLAEVEAANLHPDDEVPLELVLSLVALLGVSRAQAVALADEYTALQVGLDTGVEELAGPIGLPPIDDPAEEASLADRLATALAGASAVAALTVEVRATMLDALQQGRAAALRAQPLVVGWHRVPEPDACPLCRDMAKDGTLPDHAPMYHHKGCACAQEPAYTTTERNAA